MQILGADKIHFSYEYLHPEIFKIVQYFEEQNVVEAWQFTKPSGVSDSVQANRLVAMNELNDCFYKVHALYDYIAILDSEEVIVPNDRKDMNWEDLLGRFGFDHDSLNFKRTILNSSVSDDVIDNRLGKSLFNTKRLKIIDNHTPVLCLNSSCDNLKVPSKVSSCKSYGFNVLNFSSSKMNDDQSILKFKDQLMRKVKQTQEALKIKY